MSELHDVVRRVVDDACERLAADAAALWLRGADGSELVLGAAVGFEQPATSSHLSHRPSARVGDWLVARRLPVACVLQEKDLIGERAWLAAEAIHSVIAVPLPVATTAPGILAAFRRRRAFAAVGLSRAAGMASAAAPTVHAAQELDQARVRAERAELLLDVARTLASCRDLDSALAEVARRTARRLGAARCDIRFSPSTAPAGAALVVPIAGTAGVLGTLALEGPPPAGWTPAAADLAIAVGAEIGRAAQAARRAGDVAPVAPPELVQREALRALADLASGAAHHLNNLLTVVVGRVQLVLRSSDDDRVLRPLTIVEKAARDSADVVRRLQQFSRVRPAGPTRAVRVDRLLTEVVALSHGRWPRTPLTKVDVDGRLGEVPPIAGDPAALREAFGHVIGNAMEAMPTGGRLVIETRASDASISVAITDSGTGMPEAVRRRAAEPFFTTKGEKATGLGLSVAYGVVRSHGGDLAIESVEGAGTTVTMTFPHGRNPTNS